MKDSLLSIILFGIVVVAAPTFAQSSAAITPAPNQVAWQDLEFGVILHFSTNTFLNREWGDGTASPAVFNPLQFDPDQWMEAIRASGARYVVLVAKHHDGFCLWPTQQTDYSVRSSPWKGGKGDVIGDVARAARKYGLRFGVYLSPWDRHEPKYKDSVAYDAYYNAELEELASSYGDLVEFWLDGAGSAGHVYNFPKIIETLRTYQPNTVVFADTGLFEYGYLRWRPVEADTPLRKLHWFWHPDDEASLKSVVELLATYDATVGRGAQLMLGVAPDNRGLIPDSDAKRLAEFGAALREREANNLALHHRPTSLEVAAALDGDPDTFWSAPAGSHHSEIEVDFDKPVTFDHTLIMEWLNDGQHVEKYAIEIWDGKSSKWARVAEAQAIGHKKIDAFAPVTTDRVRLRILSSTAEAHIREFQIYHWGAPPTEKSAEK